MCFAPTPTAFLFFVLLLSLGQAGPTSEHSAYLFGTAVELWGHYYSGFPESTIVSLGIPYLTAGGVLCQTLPNGYSKPSYAYLYQLVGTLRSANLAPIGVWDPGRGCYIALQNASFDCLPYQLATQLSQCQGDPRLQLRTTSPAYAAIKDYVGLVQSSYAISSLIKAIIHISETSLMFEAEEHNEKSADRRQSLAQSISILADEREVCSEQLLSQLRGVWAALIPLIRGRLPNDFSTLRGMWQAANLIPASNLSTLLESSEAAINALSNYYELVPPRISGEGGSDVDRTQLSETNDALTNTFLAYFRSAHDRIMAGSLQLAYNYTLLKTELDIFLRVFAAHYYGFLITTHAAMFACTAGDTAVPNEYFSNTTALYQRLFEELSGPYGLLFNAVRNMQLLFADFADQSAALYISNNSTLPLDAPATFSCIARKLGELGRVMASFEQLANTSSVERDDYSIPMPPLHVTGIDSCTALRDLAATRGISATFEQWNSISPKVYRTPLTSYWLSYPPPQTVSTLPLLSVLSLYDSGGGLPYTPAMPTERLFGNDNTALSLGPIWIANKRSDEQFAVREQPLRAISSFTETDPLRDDGTCAPGTYRAADQCKPCYPGTYCPGDGLMYICPVLGVNFTQWRETSEKCHFSCPSGRYPNDDLTACVDIPVGYYSPDGQSIAPCEVSPDIIPQFVQFTTNGLGGALSCRYEYRQQALAVTLSRSQSAISALSPFVSTGYTAELWAKWPLDSRPSEFFAESASEAAVRLLYAQNRWELLVVNTANSSVNGLVELRLAFQLFPDMAGRPPPVVSDPIGWDDDEWHHIALVIDSLKMLLLFYFDGVVVGAVAYPSPSVAMATNTSVIGELFTVGGMRSMSPSVSTFIGLVDEVQTFRRALPLEHLGVFVSDRYLSDFCEGFSAVRVPASAGGHCIPRCPAAMHVDVDYAMAAQPMAVWLPTQWYGGQWPSYCSCHENDRNEETNWEVNRCLPRCTGGRIRTYPDLACQCPFGEYLVWGMPENGGIRSITITTPLLTADAGNCYQCSQTGMRVGITEVEVFSETGDKLPIVDCSEGGGDMSTSTTCDRLFDGDKTPQAAQWISRTAGWGRVTLKLVSTWRQPPIRISAIHIYAFDSSSVASAPKAVNVYAATGSDGVDIPNGSAGDNTALFGELIVTNAALSISTSHSTIWIAPAAVLDDRSVNAPIPAPRSVSCAPCPDNSLKTEWPQTSLKHCRCHAGYTLSIKGTKCQRELPALAAPEISLRDGLYPKGTTVRLRLVWPLEASSLNGSFTEPADRDPPYFRVVWYKQSSPDLPTYTYLNADENGASEEVPLEESLVLIATAEQFGRHSSPPTTRNYRILPKVPPPRSYPNATEFLLSPRYVYLYIDTTEATTSGLSAREIENVTIYYTVDNTPPTIVSPVFPISDGVLVTSRLMIRAYAALDPYFPSDEVRYEFVIIDTEKNALSSEHSGAAEFCKHNLAVCLIPIPAAVVGGITAAVLYVWLKRRSRKRRRQAELEKQRSSYAVHSQRRAAIRMSLRRTAIETGSGGVDSLQWQPEYDDDYDRYAAAQLYIAERKRQHKVRASNRVNKAVEAEQHSPTEGESSERSPMVERGKKRRRRLSFSEVGSDLEDTTERSTHRQDSGFDQVAIPVCQVCATQANRHCRECSVEGSKFYCTSCDRRVHESNYSAASHSRMWLMVCEECMQLQVRLYICDQCQRCLCQECMSRLHHMRPSATHEVRKIEGCEFCGREQAVVACLDCGGSEVLLLCTACDEARHSSVTTRRYHIRRPLSQ